MSEAHAEVVAPKSNPDAYVTGGTVQAGGGLYVKRDADDDLLVLCRTRAFVYILSTRQVGKSSLLTNVAQMLAEEGTLSVIVDLSELGGTKVVTADQWYVGLLKELRAQLGLKVEVKPWWDSHAHLPYGQRLTLFLREVLLAHIEAPVVIFVDEIDTTRSLSFTDDFYSAVRSVYNARARVPEFQRLSFVLVGVATPTDLIRDPKRTPFNIGQRVEITDFTYQEALPLTAELGLPPEEAERVLRHVLKWTNGHPNLTLRLLRVIADRTLKGKTDWPDADIDRLVDETFFGNEEVDNLSFVRDMLTIHAPDREALLTTYRDILRRKTVFDEEHSVIKSHLKLSGVVRRARGTLRVRNEIYRRAFDEAWVKSHMPANWPRRLQRAALAAVALFLIALLPLSLFAFYQRALALSALKEAEQQKGEAVRQKVEAERQEAIADGQRARAVSALEDAKRERLRAEEAARAAGAAAQAAESAKARAEKAAEAERLATEAERAAKEVAMQQQQLATEAAARAIAEQKRADMERQNAEQERMKAEEAAKLARSAAEEAEEARRQAEEARRQAEALGQVGIARQLEIQAERAWDKSDTSAAEVFFAKALAFDDRAETRGRVFTAMLRGSEKLWVSPTRVENLNVAVSGDGRTLAFIEGERVIRLRDIERGTEINNITSEGWVIGMALNTDGSKLITAETIIALGSFTRYTVSKFLVYDVKTSTSSTIDPGDPIYIKNLIFSRDASVVVANSYTDSLTVVDVPSGKVSRPTLPNPVGRSYRDISPDGKLLAGSDSSSITIYSLESNQPVVKLTPTEAPEQPAAQAAPPKVSTSIITQAIRFSPIGRRLAAVVDLFGPARGRWAIVWDLETRREVLRLPIKDLPGTSVEFGPDGRTLAVWNDLTVENWDVGSQTLLNSYSLRDVTGTPAPIFSPDGRRMVLRTDPVTLSVLDTRTGAHVRSYPLGRIDGHAAPVNSVAFSSDGKLLASGSRDSTIIIWDTESGKPLKALYSRASVVNSVTFHPADRKLLASGGNDGAVLLWNVETGEKLGELVRPPVQPTLTPSPSPTPSPTASAVRDVGSRGSGLDVGVAIVAPTLGPEVPVNSVAFSPNGKLLGSGGSDGSVRVWDVEKRQMVGEFCVGQRVNSVAFNPGGNLLASGSSDNVVRLWEVSDLSGVAGPCKTNNGKQPRELRGHKERIISVAFSPDGSVLASNGGDSQLKLWKVEDGTELYALPDQATYGQAAFSPDGVRLAVMSYEDSASSDLTRVTRVWNWSTRKLLTVLRNQSAQGTLYERDGDSIAFSPDGTLLATGRADNKIRLWRFLPNSPPDFGRSGSFEVSALYPQGHLFAYTPETSPSADSSGTPIAIKDIETKKTRQLSAREFKDFTWSHLTFSPDGKLLASVGAPKKSPADPDEEALTNPNPSTAVIWDVASGRVVTSHALDFSFRYELSPSATAFSPDGRWFALIDGGRRDLEPDAGRDGKPKEGKAAQRAVLLDVKGGTSRNIPFEAGTLWSVVFSPDHLWVILGGGAESPAGQGRKTLELHNLTTGEKVRREVGLGGAVLGMVFGATDSAGGRLLAISSGNLMGNTEDPTLRLVKLPSFEPLPLFQRFTQAVPVVAFVPGSAGDKQIITLSDGYLRLWDLDARPSEERDSMTLNTESVSVRIPFGSDGRRLLVAWSDSSVSSLDLALPIYLLKETPKKILERARQRTALHVKEPNKIGIPVLPQRELEERLKGSTYDFSFSLQSLPESPVP